MLGLLGRLGSQAVHTPVQGQETWVRTRLASSPWSVFASTVGEGWLVPRLPELQPQRSLCAPGSEGSQRIQGRTLCPFRSALCLASLSWAVAVGLTHAPFLPLGGFPCLPS